MAAAAKHPLQPLGCCWRAISRSCQIGQTQTRNASAGMARYRKHPAPLPPPSKLPKGKTWDDIPIHPAPQKIRIHPSPPKAASKLCAEPLKTYEESQIALLDPSGARTRLFSRDNQDAVRPADILLATFRNGEVYAGTCISIRRKGVDAAVLLRNELALTGVEMWVKIYSPNVVGMDLVYRREKRARRARLYYMRHPKHDRGSVQNVVDQYLRQKRLFGKGVTMGRKSETELKEAAERLRVKEEAKRAEEARRRAMEKEEKEDKRRQAEQTKAAGAEENNEATDVEENIAADAEEKKAAGAQEKA